MKRGIKLIGIDIAKSIFQVHGNDESGAMVMSRSMSRKKLIEFVSNLEKCVIGLEACGGSHYWARKFQEMGHEVRMVAPQYVKAYVRGDKTDRNDAAAIAECVSRPSTRLVAVKSEAQQEVQLWHRVRSRLVKQRTAIGNETRGMLGEFGIVIPKGLVSLKRAMVELISEGSSKIGEKLLMLLTDMHLELLELEERIEKYEARIERLCREVEVCKRLVKIPGVGPITATALWAHVGNVEHFKNGRQFASYLGLVPKQHSSGGKVRYQGITKRGDRHLRTLLIHGARAVVRHSGKKEDERSVWIRRIDEERGRNKACVALANKNARVIWALMKTGKDYRAA